jgi:hypothetical protein
MLKIENLASSKDLGRAEMQAIVGGNDIFSNSGNNAILQGSGLSFASPQIIVAPVMQIDASTRTVVDTTNIVKPLTSVGSIISGIRQ